jgi:hypothetical protein
MKAVKGGSTQTILNNNNNQVITFIDDFDPQNWWASNRFQPTIAGYYNLQLAVWWDAGAVTNNQTNIQLQKNGTTQVAIQQTQIVTGAGYGQSIDTIAYLNGTTDYIEATAYTGNTTSQNINGTNTGTWFTAALITNGTGPQGVQGPAGSGGSGGSGGYTIASTSTTYNVTSTTGTFILKCDTTGGAFQVNLPTAIDNTSTITIKKVAGSAAVTVDCFSTQNIDDGTIALINRVYESITLVSDNSNWFII